MKRPVVVTAQATIDDEEQVARTVEALSRVVAGLGMEGVTVTITVAPDVGDDE